MEAVKQAANDQDRARLRTRCARLLSRAEEIKKTGQWKPKSITLKAPISRRPLTRSEEILLLEGSKLDGYIFPPWTSDPEDSVFEQTPDIYT